MTAILKARSKRLANRNLVIGKTLFPFDQNGIMSIPDRGRTTRPDYELLLKQNQVLPLEGWVPAGINVPKRCELFSPGKEVRCELPAGHEGMCDYAGDTFVGYYPEPEEEPPARRTATVFEPKPAKRLPTKPDILVTLSDEDLEEVEVLSEEDIKEALEQGRRERDAAQGLPAPPPLPMTVSYDVVIEDIPEYTRITVYRAIRDSIGTPLSDIKNVLSDLPATVLSGVSKLEADQTKFSLMQAGAGVSVIAVKGKQ